MKSFSSTKLRATTGKLQRDSLARTDLLFFDRSHSNPDPLSDHPREVDPLESEVAFFLALGDADEGRIGGDECCQLRSSSELDQVDLERRLIDV